MYDTFVYHTYHDKHIRRIRRVSEERSEDITFRISRRYLQSHLRILPSVQKCIYKQYYQKK